MGNFFDKLGVSLTNAGRTASQKVKNSTDASKLLSKISAENKSIQANFSAMGKIYYDLCKDDPDEAFRELVEAVKESEKKIEEWQEAVKIIRAREPELVPQPEEPTFTQAKPTAMVCMNCGNTYGEGVAFCAVCGQKLVPQYQSAAAAATAPAQTEKDVQTQPETESSTPEEETITDAVIIEEKTEEEPKFCPYCGEKIIHSGQKFCEHCGQPV